MKKLFNIYISLSLLLAFFFSSSLVAQVTIGSSTPASGYSILQLESLNSNGAGLLLPRLNNSERSTLESGLDINAIGLTIYNTETNTVQYWNGTIDKWIDIPGALNPNLTASNGLEIRQGSDDKYKNIVGLGGNLTGNTDINLGGKSLNFTQPTSGTLPSFQVKSATNDYFTVTDNKVGIGTTDPSNLLHIATPAASSGFRLADGSQGLNYVLTDEFSTGFGRWIANGEHVKPVIVTNSGTTPPTPNTNIVVCQTGEGKVGKGKWLLIGKCNVGLDDADQAGNHYCWAKLTDGLGNVLSVAGIKSEINGEKWTLPEVVHYAEFETDGNIIKLIVNAPRTSGSNTNKVFNIDNYNDTNVWGSLFAIKLAD